MTKEYFVNFRWFVRFENDLTEGSFFIDVAAYFILFERALLRTLRMCNTWKIIFRLARTFRYIKKVVYMKKVGSQCVWKSK